MRLRCLGSSQQLVRDDGEIAHSFSRGVENCVCDSGARSRNPKFADASDAERIRLRVGDIDGRDIDLPDISVHRKVVISSPSWTTARERQRLVRRPLASTVQAPHWPWSHPFLLVRVSAKFSRRRSSSVTRGSTDSACDWPFTLSFSAVAALKHVVQSLSFPHVGKPLQNIRRRLRHLP